MGNLEAIESITIKNIEAWKNKYVNPSNMVLAISGNFDEDEIVEKIKQSFGKESTGVKMKFPNFDSSKYSDFSINNSKKEGDRVWFELTWPTFGWNNVKRHDELVLQILNTVLGVGPLSRLNLTLREEKNLAFYIKSYLAFFPSLGFLGISGSVHKKDFLKSLEIIRETISKIAQKGITNVELNRIKKYSEYQNVMRYETPESIANYLTSQEYDYGEIWTPNDYLKERNSIKLNEIQTMAQNILISDRMHINFQGSIEEKDIQQIKFVVK